MITKFNHFINESLLDKLQGLSEEELFNNLRGDGTPQDLLLNSAKFGFIPGIERALMEGADINTHSDKPMNSDVFHKRVTKLGINSSPIALTINNNHFEAFKYIMENCFDLKYNMEDLVNEAVRKEDINFMKYLIEVKHYDISKNNYSIVRYINKYEGKREMKNYLNSLINPLRRNIIKIFK